MKKIFLICLLSLPLFVQAMEGEHSTSGEQREDASEPVDVELGGVSLVKVGGVEVAPPVAPLSAGCNDRLGSMDNKFSTMLWHTNVSRSVRHTLTALGVGGLFWLAHSLHRTANALEGGICNN